MRNEPRFPSDMFTTTFQKHVKGLWAVDFEVGGYPPTAEADASVQKLLAIFAGGLYAILNYFPPDTQEQLLSEITKSLGGQVQAVIKLAHYNRTHMDQVNRAMEDSVSTNAKEIVENLLADIQKEFEQRQDKPTDDPLEGDS